jgi:glycine betaine/proline transport system permease protein
MSDSNPWGSPAAPATTGNAASTANSDPWGDGSTDSSSSWLDQQATTTPLDTESTIDWSYPFQESVIPLAQWVDDGLAWTVEHFRPLFQAIRWPIDATLSGIESTLLATPHLLMLLLVGLLAWQAGGRRLALGSVLSMVMIGAIGAWSEAMITLSLVLTSVIFCLLVGLPSGIWLARSERANTIARPILDAMQTTPAFVYLVPVVMLFGIGNVPGVVVTIVFALPPLIRLTMLGIRQVPEDLVEAARSFGASPRQLLFRVQLPLAMPTIMAGVNQTLMLALSMVVIASMIAVGGLGQMVLRGIGRLDMGLATIGGLGIVLLAIMLDRITQSMRMEQRDKGVRHWYERGPVNLARKLMSKKGEKE